MIEKVSKALCEEKHNNMEITIETIKPRKCDFCDEQNKWVIENGGKILSKWACQSCVAEWGRAKKKFEPTLYERIDQQEARIKKLEGEKKEQQKSNKFEKQLQRVVFWGAIASAIHAIVAMVNLLISWFKK